MLSYRSKQNIILSAHKIDISNPIEINLYQFILASDEFQDKRLRDCDKKKKDKK